jgi:hypothetical protein
MYVPTCQDRRQFLRLSLTSLGLVDMDRPHRREAATVRDNQRMHNVHAYVRTHR